MKSLILFFLSFSLFYYGKAQEISVSDMQIPDAPGFVLADKAPSAVDKPTTPRAFAISLYSLQQGGAVQATPFWFFQHPKLNQKKFVTKLAPILETFNLSVATFKTDTSSNLSLGFKTHLLRIYSKKNKHFTLDLDQKASVIITTLDSSNEEKIRQELKKLADEIAKSVSKPLLRIEFAFAYLGSSNNNSFKSLAASKAGAWLNASLSPYKSNFIITGLTRFSWAIGAEPKVGQDSIFWDYGLSLAYQNKKFDFSLEFLNRQDFSQKQNYNRLAFVINYEVSDEITLVSSFGRNFTDVNNIFTVLGAKFGISNKRKTL